MILSKSLLLIDTGMDHAMPHHAKMAGLGSLALDMNNTSLILPYLTATRCHVVLKRDYVSERDVYTSLDL